MKQIIQSLFFLLIFFDGTTAVFAQTKPLLTFEEYMENVKNKNIEYLVEKYNVDIAKANADAAKVFPDPNLSIAGTDNQERTLKMGYSFEAGLDYNLELGNKRKARMGVAQSEAELTEILVQDYFRNLRADATIAYLFALYQKQLLEVQQLSYKQMLELSRADSIRFRLGSIMEIDAKQSKLEANTMLNHVFQSETELQNAVVRLFVMQGNTLIQSEVAIVGVLTYFKRNFDLLSLITKAQNNRTDLLAALKMKELSQHNLKLAKANRAIDLGLNLGVARNAEVRNEIAPAPAFTGVTAGISIPLKFSNTNKGEVRASKLAVEQSETNYRSVELQVQSEVIQAHNLYTATCKQVEQFNSDLLTDAESIFKNKTYSYERGETSLLEVLNAQRTLNDIREKYFETLYNCAVALVELERVISMWDIEIK